MPEDDLVGRESLASLLVRLERSPEPRDFARLTEGVIAWFRRHPDYADLRRLFTEMLGQAMTGVGLPGPMPDDLMEVRTMLATLGEEWKRKWREEGLAEGQARMLIRLIEHRFGPLPEHDRARILSADEATLATWEKRLFDAESTDDILAPPH
ncbi:hypothetical protein [uncultured Rhodospira sp.]|uniref:hypothetical protein n=1 Tax=uncultured Rhodospira sp. TaxID=1936189 RepID=UPI002638D86C|nr:hypothetical protein [uncultured Rhodospira sp.]